MRKLDLHIKLQVIKLFLNGYTLDEIAEQLDIAKGSVVNIINDFRAGKISLLADMTEYIDGLRKVTVDLRKHDVSITQVKSYVTLYDRFQDLGVGVEHVEKLLNICQDIASAEMADGELLKMMASLARGSYEIGMDYKSLISDYRDKLEKSEKLDIEIEKKEQMIQELDSKHKEQMVLHQKDLKLLSDQVTSTRRESKRQEQELHSELDTFLAQNRLSWSKVKTACALLQSGLKKTGLQEKDITEISAGIAKAGSLAAYCRQIKRENTELVNKQRELSKSIDGLNRLDSNLRSSIQTKREEYGQVKDEITSKSAKLAGIERRLSGYKDEILIVRIILEFLTSPDHLTSNDFNELCMLMLSLKKTRLIIKNRLDNIHETLVLDGVMPNLDRYMDGYQRDLEAARTKLAAMIIPLCQDKIDTSLESGGAKPTISTSGLRRLT
jgi:chromosome segregation ATPase